MQEFWENNWPQVVLILGTLLILAFGIAASNYEAELVKQCKASGGKPAYETSMVWIATDSNGGGFFSPIDYFDHCEEGF